MNIMLTDQYIAIFGDRLHGYEPALIAMELSDTSQSHVIKELVKDTKNAWEALGNGCFNRPDAELGSKIFRRSIYFVSDIKSGEKIKETDIRRIRPGFGLPPKYFDKLIGKTLIKDVKRGDAVSWNMILGSENY